MSEGYLHKVFNDPELKDMWDKFAIAHHKEFWESMREFQSPLLVHETSEELSRSQHIADDHIPEFQKMFPESLFKEGATKSKSQKWKTIMSEEKNNNKTNVNVEAKEGHLEITHRYGEAPEIQEPKKVSISGTIEAPADYFLKRVDEDKIDTTLAHLEVDRLGGQIKLFCDPSSPLGSEVRGNLVLNPKLKAMEINKYGQSKFPEKDFILLIKQSRPLFSNQNDAINLIDQVQNLDVKIEKEIKKSDNNRGNESNIYTQVCQNNLPDGFTMSAPLFSGTKEAIEPYSFWVEIKFAYKDQLYFWLDSPALEDLLEELSEKMIEEQIDRFEDKVPVIYS